jgi:hypothetical protein
MVAEPEKTKIVYCSALQQAQHLSSGGSWAAEPAGDRNPDLGWEPIPGITGASGCLPDYSSRSVGTSVARHAKLTVPVRVVDEGAFRPSGKNAAVRIVEGLAA